MHDVGLLSRHGGAIKFFNNILVIQKWWSSMLFSGSDWQTFRLLLAGYNQWTGDVIVVCVSDGVGGFVAQGSMTLVCPFVHMSY